MIYNLHSARDYADAMRALLPPGAAWDWPEGGVGDGLMLGMGQELARVEADAVAVYDACLALHQPAQNDYTLAGYRAVALASIAGISESLPRQPCVIGSFVGSRLWGPSAAAETFPVSLLEVDQLVGPAHIGSSIGDQLYSNRSRYILRVRYYASIVDPSVVLSALLAFKQAHVFLWFEDITGWGGYLIEQE